MKKIVLNMKKYKIIYLIILFLIISVVVGVILLKPKKKIEESKMCHVVFDTNGGNFISSKSITCGEVLESVSDPEKEGFSFIGWYQGTELFDFSGKIENDITLVAQYQAISDDIIYVTLKSEVGNYYKMIELKRGENLSSIVTPIVDDNYEFDDWYLENQKFDFNNPINDNITLIAKWKEKKTSTNSSKKPVNNSTTNNPQNYTCQYFYYSDAASNSIVLNTSETYKSLFINSFVKDLPYRNYDIDYCYETFKSDNSSIAKIENDKIIGVGKGTTYIYNCINDTTTKKELFCVKGKLTVTDSVSTPNTGGSIDNSSKIKFSDIQGTWYKTGTNDETILFFLDSNGSYSVLTKNIDAITLKTNRESYQNQLNGRPTWEWLMDYYKIKIVSTSQLTLTRGSTTITVVKNPSIVKTNKIEFPKGDIKMMMGEKNATFQTYVYPTNANNINLSWTSSDSNIVAVKGNFNASLIAPYYKGYTGYLEAKNAGTAIITVTSIDSGISASFKVTVSKIDVENIHLNTTNMNLVIGTTSRLNATIFPSNASNKKVSWSSSNDSVASVDSEGNIVTKSNGTAIITATSMDSGQSVSCTINVTPPPLTGKASIGHTVQVGASGAVSGIHVGVTPSGGSGNYTYYAIQLYLSDGTLIGKSNSNSLIVPGYKNGSFYAEFEIRDSDGQVFHGKSGTTTISN